MNMMKKISVAILSIGMILPLSTSANEPATNNVELTPEQQNAIDFFTQTSIEIFDISEMLPSLKKDGVFDDVDSVEVKSCLEDSFENGYADFVQAKSTFHVISNTPEKIKKDISLLTPEVVSTISTFIDAGIEEMDNDEKISSDILDNLENDMDIETSKNIEALMENKEYESLKDIMGLDPEKGLNFFIWVSYMQCAFTEFE